MKTYMQNVFVSLYDETGQTPILLMTSVSIFC